MLVNIVMSGWKGKTLTKFIHINQYVHTVSGVKVSFKLDKEDKNSIKCTIPLTRIIEQQINES